MQAKIIKLHHKTTRKLMFLKKAADRDGEYRVAKRIHSVLLNSEGRTSGEISKLLHAPRSCVFEWLKNYELFGIESFLEGVRSGRPARLTEKEQQRLEDIVDSGPIAYGFHSGVWTSKMITEIIWEEFRVDYHPGHVCRLLRQLGFSVQRPTKTLAKADPVKQHKWKRYTYPNIKKKRMLLIQQ